MLHCHKLAEAKMAKLKAVEQDPNMEKANTNKCIEKFNSMLSAERYLVFNPRTGQVATEAWLSKHIQQVGGKPSFKKPSKQHKDPKILTLGIRVLEETTLQLTLDLGDNVMGPRPLRCFDLRGATVQEDLQALSSGFGHLGEDSIEDDEEDEVDFDEVDYQDSDQENEYDEELVDDTKGIEGCCPCPKISLCTHHIERSMLRTGCFSLYRSAFFVFWKHCCALFV